MVTLIVEIVYDLFAIKYLTTEKIRANHIERRSNHGTGTPRFSYACDASICLDLYQGHVAHRRHASRHAIGVVDAEMVLESDCRDVCYSCHAMGAPIRWAAKRSRT